MERSRKLYSNKGKYEIVEILGDLSPTETLKGKMTKGVLKSLWTKENGETEDGIDIRWYNKQLNSSLSGIRLTLEEAHMACNILLEAGYGSTDVLERALEKRKSLYK